MIVNSKSSNSPARFPYASALAGIVRNFLVVGRTVPPWYWSRNPSALMETIAPQLSERMCVLRAAAAQKFCRVPPSLFGCDAFLANR